MPKYFLSLFFSFLFFQIGFSQTKSPDYNPLFNDEVVPRIDIEINPDTLIWIYQNVNSDREFHARFIFDNGTQKDTINPVGFRLRGNTSRNSKKKSFKVSFNKFTKGGKYYDVEKLNLNGEHNDPSLMRSKLMWDLLRKWGIPAPRANHIRLYINGDYFGLYLNVEHIDEEFILKRFENNDGNLYKCTYPADLNYLGTNPNLYKYISGDKRAYELKTNESTDDYSDIANFIAVLNNSSPENILCELNANFDIYAYLKVIAADIFCGNWDDYIFNKNNFYLYHNPTDDKIHYLAYDVDNTFGVDWFNIDWGNRNIYQWKKGGNEQRPLYTQIINNPVLRKQFNYDVKSLIGNLDVDSLIQLIEIRKNRIAPYVENDPYYPLDYGFSYNDFQRSFTETIGQHVKYGIYPYLKTRKASMLAQLESSTMKPIIQNIQGHRETGNQLVIQAEVEAETSSLQVSILYTLNEADVYEMLLQKDTANIYRVHLSNIASNTPFQFQIKATDGMGQQQILPCEPIIIRTNDQNNKLLYINEFLASNSENFADELGNYSDWIEIYNGDSESLFLGDYFLTDDLDTPDKWAMPNVSIAAGEFELFWADNKPDLGDHHTNFKLGKSGESIGIFDKSLTCVDSLSYGAQSTDISYGRIQDGDSNWVFFDVPTPNQSNQTNVSGIDPIENPILFYAFPNPIHGKKLSLSKKINCTVYNSSGTVVFRGRKIDKIDVRNFSPGLYFIRADDFSKTSFVVF